MKRTFLWTMLSAVLSAAACAAPLATLPPSASYVAVEGPTPQLSSDEQRLVDDVNKELARLGLPQAVVGSYECNVAAVMANAALAKIWNGSGRAISKQNADVQGPVSGQESPENKHLVAGGRLNSLTDEEDDTEIKHLHSGQHLVSNGIPPNLRIYTQKAQEAQTRLEADELKKMVRSLRPRIIHGQLTIGVAVLAAGDADARLFVVALRDRSFDLARSAPRTANPGESFEVSGTVLDRTIKNMKLALAGPDGKVQQSLIPVDDAGAFSATVTLGTVPGRYSFQLMREKGYSEDVINVPIFAGTAPAPWPISADPKSKETPVDGTRSFAQRLGKAFSDYRAKQGLPAVPIDEKLSAFAKGEATLHAKAEDDQSGAGSGTPHAVVVQGERDRLHAAGFDDVHEEYWNVWNDDYVNDFFARFPNGLIHQAGISSPTLQKIGIGVALVPNTVTQDSDLVRYSVYWVIQNPTPPKPVDPSAAVAAGAAPSSAPAEAPAAAQGSSVPAAASH